MLRVYRAPSYIDQVPGNTLRTAKVLLCHNAQRAAQMHPSGAVENRITIRTEGLAPIEINAKMQNWPSLDRAVCKVGVVRINREGTPPRMKEGSEFFDLRQSLCQGEGGGRARGDIPEATGGTR